MAIVLTLVIVGWLLAFALGSQAGFDSQADAKSVPAQSARNTEATTTYGSTISAS